MDECDACEATETFALMIAVDDRATGILEPLRLCLRCVDLALTTLTIKATHQHN